MCTADGLPWTVYAAYIVAGAILVMGLLRAFEGFANPVRRLDIARGLIASGAGLLLIRAATDHTRCAHPEYSAIGLGALVASLIYVWALHRKESGREDDEAGS
jgi:hypothetical protein